MITSLAPFVIEALTIDFNRTIADNCPAFKLEPKVVPPEFKPHHLYGRPGKEVFTVEIGQSASEQGYKALTGMHTLSLQTI